MSPAEITQQLGLQSLTRRAWVSGNPRSGLSMHLLTTPSSSFNPPVPPPETVCMKVWSGSLMRSGKPTASKGL